VLLPARLLPGQPRQQYLPPQPGNLLRLHLLLSSRRQGLPLLESSGPRDQGS
jgi:hypothetical protein